MGTRGLTAVMFDGKYRIAQYGQWDHYPDGQGRTALEFCRTWLADPIKASQFASNLTRCRFVSADEMTKAYDDAKAKRPSKDLPPGLLTIAQVESFEEAFPLINRDHGAKILELVATGALGFDLKNSIDFAGDSLFCEYAYVVDLDKETLEVYKGFNHSPTPPGQRFSETPFEQGHRGENQYYPVTLLVQWKLDDLPSEDAFLQACATKDED